MSVIIWIFRTFMRWMENHGFTKRPSLYRLLHDQYSISATGQIFYDIDGFCMYANKYFLDHTGYSLEYLRRNHWEKNDFQSGGEYREGL